VLIIGDNHASNAASLLQGNLNTDYEVSGIVKPGAHRNAITDTAGKIVRSLTSDDVIIINAPQRHDLIPESCVNTKVKKFNRQLKKIVKPFPKVHLLENNLDRDLFTKHGMHLNYKGKDQTAQHLASIMEKILRKEQPVPIAIPQDVPPMVPNDIDTQDMNTDGKVCEATEPTQLQVTTSNGGTGQQGVQTSSRTRKLPRKMDSSLC
jgi:hypothetical protein